MVLRIGHRGASGTHPENTLVAFRQAVALGADGIECDVQRTRDGHLVVIHDPTLDRTTTLTGLVKDRTLAELRQADAGRWKGPQFAGERVPLLREVLREMPGHLKLFLELKAGSLHYPGIEEDLLRLLQEEDALDRVQVSSFDHHALLRLHQMAPQLPLGMLYVCNLLDPVGMARAVGATALHPRFEWVTPELVQEAHAAGMQVYTWTVNDPAWIAQMKRCGVDGIMSDFPDRI
ncbi:MAG TPA: glycerophosphodiester phosphodiesterase [Symbiobacteriaceae bacterium]